MNYKRRQFMRAAAAGAGLAATSIPVIGAPRNPKGIADFKGVRLAIATICCDGFGNEHFEPSFRLIPMAGFKYVEFNCWYPDTLTPAGLASISERCQATGLTPISVQGMRLDRETPSMLATNSGACRQRKS